MSGCRFSFGFGSFFVSGRGFGSLGSFTVVENSGSSTDRVELTSGGAMGGETVSFCSFKQFNRWLFHKLYRSRDDIDLGCSICGVCSICVCGVYVCEVYVCGVSWLYFFIKWCLCLEKLASRNYVFYKVF